MSIDAERPGATSAGLGRDGVAVQERPEHLRPVVADARQQPERHAGSSPLPGHVERAAARQHEVPPDVDVEAQRAEQRAAAAPRVRSQPGERARARVDLARGTGRSATSMTLLDCQNASTDRWPQPSAWYHSVAPGDRGEQRRVVGGHDRRAERVARRVRLADLEQRARRGTRAPAGTRWTSPVTEVDEVGVAGLRVR